MKTRTIAVFRANYNVRITELAKTLEMDVEELTAIDEIYPVPESVAEKIVNEYNLLPFYFTEDIAPENKVKTVKKTPNSPFWYFFVVTLVASVALTFVSGIPTGIITLVAGAVTNSVEVLSLATSILLGLLSIFLFLGECIIVSKYILKKTTLTGKINEFKYLWYILPNALILVPNTITSYLATNAKFEIGYSPASVIINTLTSFVFMLVGIAIQSYIFVLAIEEDSAKQNKKMRVIAICSIVSYIIYYIIRVAFIPFGGVNNWSTSIITAVFTIATAIGIIVKKQDNERLDKLIYTVLPILAIVGSRIFSIVWNIILFTIK